MRILVKGAHPRVWCCSPRRRCRCILSRHSNAAQLCSDCRRNGTSNLSCGSLRRFCSIESKPTRHFHRLAGICSVPSSGPMARFPLRSCSVWECQALFGCQTGRRAPCVTKPARHAGNWRRPTKRPRSDLCGCTPLSIGSISRHTRALAAAVFQGGQDHHTDRGSAVCETTSST